MKKFFTLIIGLVIFFNGCAEEQITSQEASLDEYKRLYNFKKDKYAILLYDITQPKNIFPPEIVSFGSSITDEQHAILIKDIESYLSDDKITKLEYSNVIKKLKTFFDKNKELEIEQVKKDVINELKYYKDLEKKEIIEIKKNIKSN